MSENLVQFSDGPAEGKVLHLRRAPWLLRVVMEGGSVDALDQLDDAPKPSESIHVYRRIRQFSNAIYCTRGKGCHHVVAYSYLLHELQPDDAAARDKQKWQAWCETQWKAKESSAEGAEARRSSATIGDTSADHRHPKDQAPNDQ
jgi:hypothetical protein